MLVEIKLKKTLNGCTINNHIKSPSLSFIHPVKGSNTGESGKKCDTMKFDSVVDDTHKQLSGS